MRLDGTVALVTGASSGIGAATAATDTEVRTHNRPEVMESIMVWR
jgi:NADP-dependent 3-hydroxy acid dehydrogenase YdfG